MLTYKGSTLLFKFYVIHLSYVIFLMWSNDIVIYQVKYLEKKQTSMAMTKFLNY